MSTLTATAAIMQIYIAEAMRIYLPCLHIHPRLSIRYMYLSRNTISTVRSGTLLKLFLLSHNFLGTFYIDPLVPAVSKGKHKSKRPLPHASFRTRNNRIELDLGTTGDVHKAPKANVSVSSKSGDIRITIVCHQI